MLTKLIECRNSNIEEKNCIIEDCSCGKEAAGFYSKKIY